MPFVHLHTHSEYSLLDGHAKIEGLLDRAHELGMPALALTDHGTMFGAVEFYRAAMRGSEKTGRPPIKPIVGCEIYFTPDSRHRREGKPLLHHLLLLARDNVGYRNLMALVSEAGTSGFYYKPQVDLELLEQFTEGLIATSACMSGIVSKSIELGQPEQARHWAETYARLFGEGNFYLEVQDQGIVGDGGVTQRDLNREIAALAARLGLPLVGTNDIHYVDAAHAQAQDMLICIQTGSTLDEAGRMRFSSDQFYMKSAAEMTEVLSEYPEAIANTVALADKCDVEIEFDKVILPVFDVPDRFRGDKDAYLEERCVEGLARRYGDPVPEEARQRLSYELGVIAEKGYAEYFLVVADFVRWAKERGIGVGPGRGSAAGSIISYSLGITNLDPLEHGLLFERFLNPERTEMPDIDIDFDDERRGEVIDYVRRRYGEDRVAQVVTFSTMKARLAIRDAGRVLGYPFGVPDKVAKQIVDRADATIGGSLASNPELRAEYEAGGDTKRILDAALALEGIVRGEGVHAAAVVICRDPLQAHTPVKRDTKGGALITQYEGEIIANLGLLKMDFLGLRTLTVIAKALGAIERKHGVQIDIENLPMDDAPTFELLQLGDTDGVFQVESAGMKRVLRELKPTCFADIVAVVALFRPGPMDSIPGFIARKHGRSKVTYYDERLKHILEETYGAMVYQEQVMRISMEMAGFSAAKADKLRKGMGKKIRKIVDGLRPEFLQGAVSRGYGRALAERVYADIEKFAEYAFNKSHAAAYALIAYQTAYLKAHYPLEYMAAVLTSYMGKSETIVKYVAACNRAGIRVFPPDANSSGKDFTAVEEGIRFGLAGIRNAGEGLVERIVAEREAAGPFSSLHDFCGRIDLRQANKRTIESLIKAGAFDSTGYGRKQLCDLLDSAVEEGLKRQKDAENRQTSLFDLEDAADHGFALYIPPPNGQEWEKRMKLAYEKEMLGIYVSDHPLAEIAALIEGARDLSLGELEDVGDGAYGWFAGILTRVEKVTTRNGKMMARGVIEDLDGSLECVFFPKVYERYRDAISVDAIVRLKAKYERSDRGSNLIVEEVQEFTDDVFQGVPSCLEVETTSDILHDAGGARLKEILGRYPGNDRVHVKVVGHDTTKVLRMPESVDSHDPGLHAELKELLGVHAVREC